MEKHQLHIRLTQVQWDDKNLMFQKCYTILVHWRMNTNLQS